MSTIALMTTTRSNTPDREVFIRSPPLGTRLARRHRPRPSVIQPPLRVLILSPVNRGRSEGSLRRPPSDRSTSRDAPLSGGSGQTGQAPFSTCELPSSAANEAPISSAGLVSGRRSSKLPSGRVTDLIEPTWMQSSFGVHTSPRLCADAVGAVASATTMPAADARSASLRVMGFSDPVPRVLAGRFPAPAPYESAAGAPTVATGGWLGCWHPDACHLSA